MPSFSVNFSTSDSLRELIPALIRAKNSFDPVLKDTKNPFYNSKYADLAGIIKATETQLSDNGLVIIQSPEGSANCSGVTTMLLHISGEFIVGTLLLPNGREAKDSKENKPATAQSGGSAITYARRYSYQAILGIAPVDDDGQAASYEDAEEPPVRRKPRVKQAQKAVGARRTEDTAPVATEPQPAEDNASNSSETEVVANLPNKEELAQYFSRAKAVSAALVKAGMTTDDKGNSVGAQLVKFVEVATGISPLTKIPKDNWEEIITKLEKAIETDATVLITIIKERIA